VKSTEAKYNHRARRARSVSVDPGTACAGQPVFLVVMTAYCGSESL